MAHFAQVDENNIVQGVYVFDLADDELPGEEHTIPEGWKWIRTSYNSRGGVHYHPNTDSPSGKDHFRYNYAAIGHVYNPDMGAFYPPKPFPSWVLDEETCTWKPPAGKEHPMDGRLYRWIEEEGGYVLEPEVPPKA